MIKDTTIFFREDTLEPDIYTYEEFGEFCMDVVGHYDLNQDVIMFSYDDVKKLQLACRRYLERNKQ